MDRPSQRLIRLDLEQQTLREVNDFLHQRLPHEFAGGEMPRVEILNPNGRHNVAVGLDTPVEVDILGHAGYFIAGMNKAARVTVHGNVGWSVAENIMSGTVRVKGCASECAGASGRGGLLVIEGDASSRCGISLKGSDIVVAGSVGHMAAFMAQAGTLVVCGDAGAGLGDSLYEAVLYVRGQIAGLGADARIEPLSAPDHQRLTRLLAAAGLPHAPQEFQRVGSARNLYHWHADRGGAYG